MLIFRNKNNIPFCLAKTSNKQLKADYRILLEKSTILSIAFIILLLFLFPQQRMKKYHAEELSFAIQVIDIPIQENEIPPPSIEIIEPTPVVVKDDSEKERNLKEEIQNEEVQLELGSEVEENFFAGSQLGEIHKTDFRRMTKGAYSPERLQFDYEQRHSALNENQHLSLDVPVSDTNRKKKKEAGIIDSKSLLQEVTPPEKTKTSSPVASTPNDVNDIFEVAGDQFLLRESESTIGTIEYQIWNRINASLDRLNKDRYGDLPINVKRLSNGLAVSFLYSDGSRHDIYWTIGGYVIIRVTNHRTEGQITELKKAYDGLLHLIYESTS